MSETIDKTRELETKGIKSLLWTYAWPAVVSQIIASVYNIVDRVFLGHSEGDLGPMVLAGLAVTFPIMNIIHAFGALVGAGSSARMSIVLGRKDERWAEKILGNSVLLTFLFGFIFVSVGYLLMGPMLDLFGATDQTRDYACGYMEIVLPGMFLTTLAFNLTGLIRASGYPMKAMFILAGGAILNILLDALFIPGFGWGIRGAAWATTISMAVSSIFAVAHFLLPKSFIRFKRHCWAPKFYIFRNILAIGISPFSMNVAGCAVVAVLNRQLLNYGGDQAIGAYGVVNSATFLVLMLFLGVCQGMQPIAGYNYGAGHSHRLKEIYTLTMKVCLVIGVLGCAVSMIFPRAIISCFDSDHPDFINLGIPALRYLMVFAPLIGYTVTNSQFFQSIDKPWIAIVTSLSRQVIFLIPLVLLMPEVMVGWGFDGVEAVWICCAACDVLAATLSTMLLLSQRKVFRPDYVAPVRKPRKELGPSK